MTQVTQQSILCSAGRTDQRQVHKSIAWYVFKCCSIQIFKNIQELLMSLLSACNSQQMKCFTEILINETADFTNLYFIRNYQKMYFFRILRGAPVSFSRILRSGENRDSLSRILRSSELPIGVVTAFFGAPFFAVVLRTSRSMR